MPATFVVYVFVWWWPVGLTVFHFSCSTPPKGHTCGRKRDNWFEQPESPGTSITNFDPWTTKMPSWSKGVQLNLVSARLGHKHSTHREHVVLNANDYCSGPLDWAVDCFIPFMLALCLTCHLTLPFRFRALWLVEIIYEGDDSLMCMAQGQAKLLSIKE